MRLSRDCSLIFTLTRNLAVCRICRRKLDSIRIRSYLAIALIRFDLEMFDDRMRSLTFTRDVTTGLSRRPFRNSRSVSSATLPNSPILSRRCMNAAGTVTVHSFITGCVLGCRKRQSGRRMRSAEAARGWRGKKKGCRQGATTQE